MKDMERRVVTTNMANDKSIRIHDAARCMSVAVRTVELAGTLARPDVSIARVPNGEELEAGTKNPRRWKTTMEPPRWKWIPRQLSQRVWFPLTRGKSDAFKWKMRGFGSSSGSRSISCAQRGFGSSSSPCSSPYG